MRRHYEEITGRGADVVAVGTGDLRYAKSFVSDERVPFPVVVDEQGDAARAASLKRGTVLAMMSPASFPGAIGALRRGHRVHRTGARPMQLGATFVVGPGDRVVYEHLDRDPSDHAPLDDVLAALPT